MGILDHSQIAELVVKAQQGDQDAFAALYTATVDRQLYFATAFLRDQKLAEDAVQETYMRMFSSINKLNNPRVFVSYLNRICYNVCVDFNKKNYAKKFELDEDIFAWVEDTDIFSSPDGSFETKELQNDLLEALSKLTDREKTAFLLRYYHELKIGDISKTMLISESTVKRSVNSAIDKLKGLLENTYNEQEGGGDHEA